MSTVLVSICCIAYNHEKYIANAIESFLMQKTNFDYEVLIHDDASTDKTPDIINYYKSNFPDIIKPLIQTENQYSKGVGCIHYKYNFSRAKGKYIALCEGDDYWTDPYKLQKQVDYMENNPKCGMCFHAANKVRVNKKNIGVIKPYDENCISKTEDIIIGDGGFMATSSILHRKDIMENAPDFCLNAPVGDYPLQIICSTQEYAYYINDFMSVYRVGVEGSWSSRMNLEKNRDNTFYNFNKRIIDMLNQFNEFSGGIYSEAVKKKILVNEFEMLKIKKDIKQLKMKRFRSIYDSLGVSGKIKIYIRCHFPNIYYKLLNIKNVLKSFF
jgi:glycosyltransferase involved in cell wall biosynthesis